MAYIPSTINNTIVTHSWPEHFTATHTSNVTITCSNAPFTIDDTVCTVVSIMYKPTWWTRQNILKNRENWVSMVASSNVITVTWAWTPFTSWDTYEVGVNYIPSWSDLWTDTQKVTNQNPDSSYYQDVVPLISSAQTLTTSFADIGFEVPCAWYKTLFLRLKITIQNSIWVQLQALPKHTSAGTEEYNFVTITQWNPNTLVLSYLCIETYYN